MQLLGTWLVAFQAIRLDGGRNPIGRRTESDRTADGALRGCTCLKCTNKTIKCPTKLSSAPISFL